MSSYASKITKLLRAQFKDFIVPLGGDARAASQVVEVIPTGIEVLDDYVLGAGGLPVGRVSEVFSEEGAGKTSVAYSALGQVQRGGGVAVLVDSEQAFDDARARLFGVDPGHLVFAQPDTLEDALSVIHGAVRANDPRKAPMLVVWDSLAAAPTREEVEAGVAPEKGRDVRAQVLSQAARQFARVCADHRAHLMVVNQIRDKRGIMFGNNTTTPGGHAIKFLASVRLQLWSGKAFKVSDEHVGKTVTVMSVKNRMCPPFRKVRVKLDYARGWDNDWSVLEWAKTRGAVELRARGDAAVKDAREALRKFGVEEPDTSLATEGVAPDEEPVEDE